MFLPLHKIEHILIFANVMGIKMNLTIILIDISSYILLGCVYFH